jgi:KAT8 regulatory NSL complex subunit 2
MITKDKLVRLQGLYIDQFQRLKHVLKERRRKYLHSMRRERETCMSIYNQAKETPREQKLYKKYKALQHYHKKFGVEAILYRKHVEKRAKVTDGLMQKPNQQPKCIFTEGGVKCGDRPLPACKFCRKHIFEDKKQVFFRPCNVEKSGNVCQEPVASIFEDSTCVLHIELPQPRVYTQKVG